MPCCRSRSTSSLFNGDCHELSKPLSLMQMPLLRYLSYCHFFTANAEGSLPAMVDMGSEGLHVS